MVALLKLEPELGFGRQEQGALGDLRLGRLKAYRPIATTPMMVCPSGASRTDSNYG